MLLKKLIDELMKTGYVKTTVLRRGSLNPLSMVTMRRALEPNDDPDADLRQNIRPYEKIVIFLKAVLKHECVAGNFPDLKSLYQSFGDALERLNVEIAAFARQQYPFTSLDKNIPARVYWQRLLSHPEARILAVSMLHFAVVNLLTTVIALFKKACNRRVRY
jgi:hypothetical protein